MMGSCSYIDLQLNRRGGRLMIGSAYERVYTVVNLIVALNSSIVVVAMKP